MKKAIKMIFGCIVILCAVLAVNKVLSYLLIDDADDDIRYAMHELYEQEEIETLFLGSSHVFCGYDPRVLDEGLQENTYLAATPVQKVDGSYYLLKEVLKKNRVKKVYLDMFYWQYRDVPAERGSGQMQWIYCITDYMKSVPDKTEFLLNASGCEYYIESFLPAARYGNYLLDYKRLERVVKSKRSVAYRNYENVPGSFYKGAYIEPGASGNPKRIVNIDNPEIPENVISDYSMEYLNRIVELCREEGIELVLVTTPFTDSHIQIIGNYDSFYQYVKNYAKEKGIAYYDFNLCKPELLDKEYDDFIDYHHLSGKGAVKYSQAFAKLMTLSDEAKRQELFYGSVAEKMNDLPRQTMGVLLQKSAEEETLYSITTVANYDVEAEYRICTVDEQGTEMELIQDFCDEDTVRVSPNADVTYKIMARDKNTGEICEEGIIKLP